MSNRFTRRRFVYGSALATGGLVLLPNMTRNVLGANEKLNVAGIGCGGKGESDIMKCANLGENIVAGADIDSDRVKALADKASKKTGLPCATYDDWRVMLEKEAKNIDAVTISTPDHSHAVAAAMAMSLGKHVYVQKPLTHTVYEARVLRKLAREKKVCTQMGNQGTTLDTLRTGVEIVQSGVIGDVKELHCWSNRPVWPQGEEMTRKFAAGKGAATPKSWNYDVWLGPASERPFNGAYGHFIWRGFWDFGTGALGDMACHTMNLPFWALNLEYPTAVNAKVQGLFEVTPPDWSVIRYDFPERKVKKADGDITLAPVTMYWYDGHNARKLDGKSIGLPAEEAKFKAIAKEHGATIGDGSSGALFIGSKGVMLASGDYADRITLLPKEKFPGDYKKHAPTSWLPRHAGGDMDSNQTKEWLAAIRASKPSHAMSNFEFAAYFTEIILLGNLAMRVPNTEIKWDGPAMKSPNSDKANSYVHHEYRKGWTLPTPNV